MLDIPEYSGWLTTSDVLFILSNNDAGRELPVGSCDTYILVVVNAKDGSWRGVYIESGDVHLLIISDI